VRSALNWVANGLLVLGLALPALAGAVQKQSRPDVTGLETLRVGSVTLHRCETPAPWCGTLRRPLDPSGTVPGTISIYFEFYPHTDPRAGSVGTLVATEGGPGYPATDTREEYLELFAPLRHRRDVVLMDNRGTGRSGAIDCRPLQTDATLTEANIGQCGSALGSKAALYSTALAADDLAAILDALAAGPVDLYGDSYGTFFEQVFAVRHPGKLRSIVLDGAYPLDGGSDYAWYPNYAPAMRLKFDLACKRSEDCSRVPGSSMEHVTPTLESLRRKPTAAVAPDGDGRPRRFTATAGQLATVMFGSAPAYATLRETDAAARAYLDGDPAPLFRLMAEAQTSVDSRDPGNSPAKFSAGLAAAVMCEDAPQIFDMTLNASRRARDRERALTDRRRLAPDTYAPFTFDEYRAMPLDYAFIDQCARWPALGPERVVSVARLRASPYPDVPALVISGDLDNMTPVADGTLVARKFAQGRQVIVPNGLHVNALAHSRSGCPADIARRFIETLDVGDTRCLQSIPEVRVLGRFARRVSELEPARAVAGNGADRAQLQIATAAVLTVGDAIARVGANTTGKAVGLRGGTIDIAAGSDVSRLTLHDVRWTGDLGVSGTVVNPGRSGDGSADVVVTGPGAASGSLTIRWTQGKPRARASVRGMFGRVTVAAETPAP
jgi:pimeloyl-ACP methyl ester carboxylesterase